MDSEQSQIYEVQVESQLTLLDIFTTYASYDLKTLLPFFEQILLRFPPYFTTLFQIRKPAKGK